jgi:N-acetylglucosaminyl-diphospho-decaprenol L-rhamnosyltransferase
MLSPLTSARLSGNAVACSAISPHIYAVVPVHNRKALLERFLTCMRQQSSRNFTIVVVDDGSTDGTSTLVQEKFPEVHLLAGDGNLWWTGATNLGIRHALTQAQEDDAILIINDDIEVDSDYLESLLRAWLAVPNALVGSVVVDVKNPEVIYEGGHMVNWWTAKIRTLNVNKLLSDFGKDHCIDVSFLTGRGTLIPVRVFRDIGLFDQQHFQQCGDSELPVRAKNRGYRLMVSYAAIAKLHIDQSAGINTAVKYSLKDFREYFFGVKSNLRLKYRFFFSYNSATNPAQFCCFLLCSFVRITTRFLLRLRFKREIRTAT